MTEFGTGVSQSELTRTGLNVDRANVAADLSANSWLIRPVLDAIQNSILWLGTLIANQEDKHTLMMVMEIPFNSKFHPH